ncbi:hypothetical protein ACFFIF_10795 [Vagococcus entomophilus]|uniref:DUF1310 domain-containing protein n=1 Tax=Vagococcus entomophilus TaxID=1160095 RepID=A0A430AF21_9ENTE|nr:hypothetical protein [Vagococcus entomophilus]RSU06177.1 hypothetical protein CBF30_10700 [Vagococcus entomophilus]
MKKKKWIWLILGVMIILGFIGGKVYMDKREGQSKKELIEVERQSVKALKNTFENIKEVNIQKIGYNSMTGSYRMLVTMINIEGKSAIFSYGFVKDNSEIDTYVLSNIEVQKEGKTTDKIKVIYSNGEEGEI